MEEECNIGELIKRGVVVRDAEGETPAEIYKVICDQQELPEYLSKEQLYTELVQREELMCTAVGNGMAIPHPRYPLLKNEEEQRIIVCYPKKALAMVSPDSKPVFVFFVILSSSSKVHLKILSRLAFLMQNKDFRQVLSEKPSAEVLSGVVDRILNSEDKSFNF